LSYQTGQIDRTNYARIKDSAEMPDLLDIQKVSFDEFIQEDTLPEKRKHQGLQQAFKGVFPIYSYDGNTCLEFVSYSLGTPRYSIEECQRRSLTFAVPLKVKLRLKSGGTVREETVFMGNIPKMTAQGSFIINGAERVIVSQLHRTPGICFEVVKRPGAGHGVLYMFRIIPTRGSWLEAEFNRKGQIYFYLDKKRSSRKFLGTSLLRALGFGSDRKIIELFCETEKLSPGVREDSKKLLNRYLSAPVLDEKQTVLFPAYTRIDKGLLDTLRKGRREREVEVFVPGPCVEPLIAMFEADPTASQEMALRHVYKRLRPGDPPTDKKAADLIDRRFFDVRRFDLGRVGRYKLNQKLGRPTDRKVLERGALEPEDIVEAMRYLMMLNAAEPGYGIDDIDHLGMRRVAMVGELLQDQCRSGLARLERMVKDKMNVYETTSETLTPHKLVNPKAISSVLRDFFGRSQLSQFMDQTNPLAELTHKRRLTALGPGGLSRKRAGFEVRDVHSSHYGRICPIETPEGPNIGLISSLSTFARVNDLGFIETPYRRAEKGKLLPIENKQDVKANVAWLTADEEEKYIIAQANVRVDGKGRMIDPLVQVRHNGDPLMAPREDVQLVDVSPKQLVSVAASLIPFLEHDDANRALMGSNMQRQAVPLMTTEAPIVATGLEGKTAVDTRVMVLAEESGTVEAVDARRIVVGEHEYRLRKFFRSNAGTCTTQTPIVLKGQKVKKGDVLADGPGTAQGELALGRNVLACFMPWRGYNFEDAIVISERLVQEDVYTSIHIEEYEIGARDTKLGREEITRDIPGVGEEALRNLDSEGVVRIGAEVGPGDILVGKITPKGETELLPEEKLLRAIFGEKAADVKDTSLRVSSGVEGIVMDVKVFSRRDEGDDESDQQDKIKIKEIKQTYQSNISRLREERQAALSKLILGQKLGGSVEITDTADVVIPGGKKITQGMMAKLEPLTYEDLQFDGEDELTDSFRKLMIDYEVKFEELDLRRNQELEEVRVGDELEPGVIKKVRVYIATKRKLQVGDKMAGRHGNKGVIAKILPVEDMPFLADGTPVDIVLNPLGVPSRMNVGQVLETHLGWAGKILGLKFSTPVFDGIPEAKIRELMEKAELPSTGKVTLYDGRTGNPFGGKVVVGSIYMMKLHHLVAEKIHARATGPYSLVTQQPLGGKAQYGGQRFGEMEVWALEAYGAAYALQEMLTVKSDDIMGRTRIYESIVKGSNTLEAGTPESFKVLIKELRSLALDVRMEKSSETRL